MDAKKYQQKYYFYIFENIRTKHPFASLNPTCSFYSFTDNTVIIVLLISKCLSKYLRMCFYVLHYIFSSVNLLYITLELNCIFILLIKFFLCDLIFFILCCARQFNDLLLNDITEVC